MEFRQFVLKSHVCGQGRQPDGSGVPFEESVFVGPSFTVFQLMPISSQRWKEISPTRFPWEREALDFVRERLPDVDPYQAWTTFEFIADDGTINEVDLLVLTPR